MSPLRVALIGAGAFGRQHLRAWGVVPDADIVAVVDSRMVAAREAAQQAGPGTAAVLGLEELSELEIDCASVVNPSAEHVRTAMQLMGMGIDVLIEKPLASDLPDAIELEAFAQRARRICMPGHILRFAQPYVELKAAIDDGHVGDPVGIHARRDRSSALTRLYPGEVPMLLTGVHDIDLALWLSSSPVRTVRAVSRSVSSPSPSLVWAILIHENGTISSVQSTYLLPEAEPDATSDRIDVYGTKGAAFVDFSVPPLEGQSGQRAVLDDALVSELRHFALCVNTRQPSPIISIEDAVHGVAVASAIVTSAENDGAEMIL